MQRSLSAAVTFLVLASPAFAEPLASWRDSTSKAAILSFVEDVTTKGSADFVPVADRIAVFDNDGTLWSEQPVYFQLLYALDKVSEKAESDPSILTSDVLRAAAQGDMKTVLAGGEAGLLEVLNVSHGNITVDAFKADAKTWMTTAKHPQTGMTYAGMTYQPMVELLEYLRDEGFSTYIVSGGGVDFIRAISEDAYGIPPQQVVGSEGKTHYEVKVGVPTLIKDGGVSFIDDKDGKPVGINRFIGKRPIFAGGNSDGDFQMLEWTTAGDGARFGLLVHHTDGEREFAYDRDSHIGSLNAGLDQAADRGWVLVDMENDWTQIWTGDN